jgi:DNA-binding NarL/FixJ family response regulator
MRIIVAEDSTLLREGLVGLLERFGHTIVGAASDAATLHEAVDRAAASGGVPDIVITDVRMPPDNRNDGLDAAIRLRVEHPGLPVLLLSQYVVAAYADELLADPRGGVGYLLKDRVGRVSDFMASVEVVARGGTVIDPDVVRALMAPTGHGPLDQLTAREREVLALMAEGKGNADIASELVVSEAAIAKHIGNVFSKLGLAPNDAGHRRVQAVLAYLRS